MLEAMKNYDFSFYCLRYRLPAYKAENPGLDDGDILLHLGATTFVFNLTQQPASSVPCGKTSLGLPVGLRDREANT